MYACVCVCVFSFGQHVCGVRTHLSPTWFGLQTFFDPHRPFPTYDQIVQVSSVNCSISLSDAREQGTVRHGARVRKPDKWYDIMIYRLVSYTHPVSYYYSIQNRRCKVQEHEGCSFEQGTGHGCRPRVRQQAYHYSGDDAFSMTGLSHRLVPVVVSWRHQTTRL